MIACSGPYPEKFACILADPPWLERGCGKVKRGADRHYPLLRTPEIVQTMLRADAWRPGDPRWNEAARAAAAAASWAAGAASYGATSSTAMAASWAAGAWAASYAARAAWDSELAAAADRISAGIIAALEQAINDIEGA